MTEALALAGLPRVLPRRHLNLSRFPPRVGANRVRLRATSQDNKAVSTGSGSSEQEEGQKGLLEAQDEKGEEDRSEEDIAAALREMRKQQEAKIYKSSLVEGLMEEIGLIEWPGLGKVFGTTVVVMGIIIGSSVVLLTVNFLLAESSSIIFKPQ